MCALEIGLKALYPWLKVNDLWNMEWISGIGGWVGVTTREGRDNSQPFKPRHISQSCSRSNIQISS